MLYGIGLILLMLHIITGSRRSQLESCRILLGIILQALYLFRLLSRTENQHTCRQWIQGTSMSYLHPLHPYFLRNTGTDESQCAK